MTDLQQQEITRLHDQIHKDVAKLIDKYMKVMTWEVPENNEDTARELILKEIRNALDNH